MATGRMGRRSVLGAGAGLVGAGLLGTGSAVDANAACRGRGQRRGQRFDVASAPQTQFTYKPLQESAHIMQSFTIDSLNRRIFVAQGVNGGSGTDLCINQLDFDGNLQGSMELKHAGHGVSIGCEPLGDDTYIWMECDADGDTKKNRGTALGRFRFVDGAVPELRRFLTGSKTITCATDPIFHRLLVRRHEGEGHDKWWSLFDLKAAARGDFDSPLVHVRQPSIEGPSFQGYTVMGRYAYMLHGNSQRDPGPNYENINSSLSTVDLGTGRIVQHARTLAGKDVVFREPEGMAVYRTPAGENRLYFGFASREVWEVHDDSACLFYVNGMLPRASCD